MFAIALFTSSFFLSAPAPPADDPAKAERERWQGTWRVTQMEITTGQRTARLKFTEADDAVWRVKDDALEIVGLMFPFSKAKMKFDVVPQLKGITLTLTDGPKKGEAVEGTYTREEDRIELDFPVWPKEKDETAKLRFILKRVGN